MPENAGQVRPDVSVDQKGRAHSRNDQPRCPPRRLQADQYHPGAEKGVYQRGFPAELIEEKLVLIHPVDQCPDDEQNHDQIQEIHPGGPGGGPEDDQGQTDGDHEIDPQVALGRDDSERGGVEVEAAEKGADHRSRPGSCCAPRVRRPKPEMIPYLLPKAIQSLSCKIGPSADRRDPSPRRI